MTRSSFDFRNATVVDGSGSTPFTAHVLVADGRIESISETPHGADRVVDLDGSFLAPGFVDMHSHSELRLFESPEAREKITQGVTLEVFGQDGVSVAPVTPSQKSAWADRVQSLLGRAGSWEWESVGEFMDELDAAEPAVNGVYYAPHGNLRSTVAGFDDRPLSSDEVDDVSQALDDAMSDGAFAMSTGMIYPPSSYGRDDELEVLAGTLAEWDSLMISHVWNESDRVVESIERFVDICVDGGCQPLVSHLKVAGERNEGRSTEVLNLFDRYESAGVDVVFDQYPYTAGSTMLTALLPPWVRKGESEDIKRRLERPAARERIRDDIYEGSDWENIYRAAGSWDDILLTRTRSGNHEGQTIAEVAAERGTEPIDALCDLLVAEDLDATMVEFFLDETDVSRFLADKRGTICTDGIFGGKPHPRAVATFTRLLERYVRSTELLSVEEAVYKAAGLPADVLGLPNRGRIAEGYVADLVTFDLDAVTEHATYEDPLQFSDGIEYVLIGGTPVVEAGAHTGARPGSVLRSTDVWNGTSRPVLRSRVESEER